MSDITVVNGPLSIYWAAVGTVFPGIAVDPTTAGFTLLGTSGDKNYTDDGVSINPGQTIEDWIPLGGTFPRKSFRTEEELLVTVKMADLSLAQVRASLNQNTITANASDSEINLDRGLSVSTIALLVRGTGKSAEVAAGNLQFELFEVREGNSQELSFVKGEPAGVELEFRALDNSTNGVGVLRSET